MDAIVTITLMTGKNVAGTIEKAIKLPAEVEASLAVTPEKSAQWIYAEAYKGACAVGSVSVALPPASAVADDEARPAVREKKAR